MLSRATNPSSFLKGLQIKPEDFIAMQLEANAKVDKHNEEERLRSWHSRRVMPGRTYQGPLFDSYTGYTGQ
jgi:regulatory protein YycI of two-component signal transduction system YycFG